MYPRRLVYTQVDATQWVVGGICIDFTARLGRPVSKSELKAHRIEASPRHQYGRRTGPVDRATRPGRFHGGRPSSFRDRSTGRLRHADEERSEVRVIDGRERRTGEVHVAVTQLKRAVAAIGEGAEKVGLGKQFVAQAKATWELVRIEAASSTSSTRTCGSGAG
ncbi:hypothetical protein KFL_003950100 [Klebsormidium nitens]|uniref:Uncharacterized protein n=1 Tax=Klebsormidium nitens TaxID=105231 RepID=A0A1Y1IBT4_KLENI|nr:hypothetical protein KFL_003950100 [Klebsormidium nitens]|eukprot:GAQ88033.1 hypothetical protein KFL_003950100 [Klebsormidium nitens]